MHAWIETRIAGVRSACIGHRAAAGAASAQFGSALTINLADTDGHRLITLSGSLCSLRSLASLHQTRPAANMQPERQTADNVLALPLPHIGQADYMPLLIEALQTLHPQRYFDARVFVGMLIAIVAGERNLIVDVDTCDLTRELHVSTEQQRTRESEFPLGDGSTRSLKTHFASSIALLEVKVQTTVEFVSFFPLACSLIYHLADLFWMNDSACLALVCYILQLASSVFGLTCHSSRASSLWKASQAPGCLFPSLDTLDCPDSNPSACLTSQPFPLSTESQCNARHVSHVVEPVLEPPSERIKRLPQVLILTSLHRATNAVQSKIWEMLDRRKVGGLQSGKRHVTISSAWSEQGVVVLHH